mmetsp:Transcript_13606/g.27560  ORF Transcript_13606/g.27560 Transcript_13606/m.27560 type:complete len:173 (+) Transcript_13606:215-733(+)
MVALFLTPLVPAVFPAITTATSRGEPIVIFLSGLRILFLSFGRGSRRSGSSLTLRLARPTTPPSPNASLSAAGAAFFTSPSKISAPSKAGSLTAVVIAPSKISTPPAEAVIAVITVITTAEAIVSAPEAIIAIIPPSEAIVAIVSASESVVTAAEAVVASIVIVAAEAVIAA